MLDNYSLLSFIQFYFIFFFSPLSKLVFSVYFFNDSMHSVLSQPNKVSNNNRKSFITFVFAIIACIEEDKSISLGWIFPTLASGKTIFSQLLYLLLLQLYENWKRNAHSYSNLFRSTLKTIFFLFREQNCISFFLKFFFKSDNLQFFNVYLEKHWKKSNDIHIWIEMFFRWWNECKTQSDRWRSIKFTVDTIRRF